MRKLEGQEKSNTERRERNTDTQNHAEVSKIVSASKKEVLNSISWSTTEAQNIRTGEINTNAPAI